MKNTLLSTVWMVAAACACAVSAGAQDGVAGVAGAPAAAGADQAQVDGAAQPGRLTRALAWADRMSDQSLRDGFYPEMGGMIPGAGFSAGPGYRHHLFGDAAIVEASAAVSWHRYQTMQAQLSWPRLLGNRLTVGGQIKYQDFTQINFFGVGAESQKGNQTDYRLTDVDAAAFATFRPSAPVSMTGRSGLLRRVDIGRGTSSLYPSTGDLFDEASAPGLTQQPTYLHADVALDVDTRDFPGYPASGGRYRVSMAAFHDQTFGHFSFRRFEADAARYLPLGRSVFALRGRLGMSQTGTGQEMPFYMLPTLGGSNSLRGYLDYRFRDRNVLLADAEYRWPIARLVDAAVFYDAGTVAPDASGLTSRLTTDYGIGVRLHSARHLIARLDVARGREGVRAAVSFSAPLAPSRGRIAPYVP
jgi:outer membrane protein assembly factor BamA